MKKGHEPPESIRPSLGGAERFEALFEHARRDAFTPDEAERLWQSVVSAGPGAGDAGPDLPAAQGWSSVAALKIGAGLVLAGALLAVGFAVRSAGPHEPAATPSGTLQVARRIDAPRSEGGPPSVSWEDLPRAGGDARPATRSAKSHYEPSVQAPELPVAEAASSSVAPASVPDEPVPVPVASVSAVPPPSEGALLLRARQQLPSDPRSALELTDEAGRRYPDGALAPEREVLAIEALARLGELASARARFAAFRTAYPQSPHLSRLASLIGR
jgi:hypothetical protein